MPALSKRWKFFTGLTALLLLLFFNSCSESVEQAEQANSGLILGLSSVLHTDIEVTVIDLADYVLDPYQVDSVTLNDIAQELGGSEVHIHEWPEGYAMAPLKLWSSGKASIIPVKKTEKKRVTFEFDSQGQEFGSLKMKGEMCNWNPDELSFSYEDGIYTTEFIVEPRDYQYVMILDGEEHLDSNNPLKADNGMGSFNSVLSYSQNSEEDLWISARLESERIVIDMNDSEARVLALWQNEMLEVEVKEGTAFIFIPSSAKQMSRSHVRVWAHSSSQVSNDLLIPLERGEPIGQAEQLQRTDKHAMTLYNVFVDRFVNGDESNDRPINSQGVLPQADDMGGDIKGAIQKLEEGYFEALGINTIWISPIVKNVEGPYGNWPEPKTQFSAYHGYWPVSFTLVDNRKGSPKDLHELVAKAHDRDMNVLLDFVANHVHEEHPYYKANPDKVTELYLPDGSLNTERWDDHRLTTWFDVFMPTLQLDDPEVYEMLTDSALYWIEEYNLDGFRHDATKHVPEIFWKTLTKKLKKNLVSKGKDIYQIGETYGTPELISGYVNSGQLDAQFDFNVYDQIVASLCRNEIGFDRLNQEIGKSLDTYGHHHLMGNITGNQDRGRFISYAGGALRFDENAKVAGWTREVLVGKDEAYDRSQQLMALIATIPGLPVIYYGDEVGSYGGNDPDNRKMMKFEDLTEKEQGIKTSCSSLLQFRNSSLPLIYGDFYSHIAEQDEYLFSRTYLGETVYIALNSSATLKEILFKPEAYQSIPEKSFSGDKFEKLEANTISIQLQANSFEILY